jgi:1-acyl-sn-glycerol-3-phosphate acyltransferase
MRKGENPPRLRWGGVWLRLGRRLGGERLLLLAGRVLARLKIEGEHWIPAQGACLLAFNHVSQPADLLLNTVIRRRRPHAYVFAAQGWQGQNPLAAFLARIGDRDAEARMLRAYKARGLSGGELLAAHHVLLDDGAIAIAVEGEITWDGRLQHPLAPGAAWLSLRTAAPVVPIVSIGGYDMQPRWQMDRLQLPGRLTIRVGRPLYLSEGPRRRPGRQELEAANERLWQTMAALLAGREGEPVA